MAEQIHEVVWICQTDLKYSPLNSGIMLEIS